MQTEMERPCVSGCSGQYPSRPELTLSAAGYGRQSGCVERRPFWGTARFSHLATVPPQECLDGKAENGVRGQRMSSIADLSPDAYRFTAPVGR